MEFSCLQWYTERESNLDTPGLDSYSSSFMQQAITAAQFNTPFYARIAESMSGYTAEGKSYEEAVRKTAEMARIYISE